MLKPAIIALVLVAPQVAQAADLPYRHHHVRHALVRQAAEDHVIRCTTTDLGLITFANCGQTFDPFSAAVGR